MFICKRCAGSHFDSHLAVSFGRCEACDKRGLCIECMHSNEIITEADVELARNLVNSAKDNFSTEVSEKMGELGMKYRLSMECINEISELISKSIVEAYQQGHSDFATLMINNLDNKDE